MAYLNGEQLEISTPILRKHIGQKIEYLLERDIDKSGRGVFFPRLGHIEDVYKRHVCFENGNYIHFNEIREIILIE